MSLSRFNAQLTTFSRERVPAAVLTLQKKISLEGLGRIVLKTPVDTGRARGNWMVSLVTETDQHTEITDRTGSSAISAGTAVINEARPFQAIYIQNNVPYIEELENGRSDQAPAGMLGLTFSELVGMFVI